jgi:methionine biosynthesis protein MetW
MKKTSLRADLAFISERIGNNAHVLDIGCGDGAMLEHLHTVKGCTGYGIEIDEEKIQACTRRGINVIERNMEKGLGLFADDSFDTVLCLSSLQMMKNVEDLLKEFSRVGREAIVSFPNFAYWPHRLSLLCGSMPVSSALPHDWYDTPNVRCATITDFTELANHVGLKVLECVALHDGKPVSFLPNVRGTLAVFRLRK